MKQTWDVARKNVQRNPYLCIQEKTQHYVKLRDIPIKLWKIYQLKDVSRKTGLDDVEWRIRPHSRSYIVGKRPMIMRMAPQCALRIFG